MRYLLLVCALALSGCKTIQVKNGEVPDEYRAMAQAYMGTYAGSMNGFDGALTLALSGRKVVLSYRDADGSTDILDARCASRIGNLQTVEVSKVKSLDGSVSYKLDSAVFAFDPNRCWGSVDGREIVLDFTKKSAHVRVDASILARQDYRRECRIDPGNPRQGIPPHEFCNDVPYYSYMTGQFQK